MIKDDLHPALQTAIIHLANPGMSLGDIGKREGITKQAVHKRLRESKAFLATYGQEIPPDFKATALAAEVTRQAELIKTLQRRLILQATSLFMLLCLKERILAFFPKFKLSRLSPFEKKESSTSGPNSNASVVASRTLQQRPKGRLTQSENGSPIF